jgi:hypothetical protein
MLRMTTLVDVVLRRRVSDSDLVQLLFVRMLFPKMAAKPALTLFYL